MPSNESQQNFNLIDVLVKAGSFLGSVAFLYTLRINMRNVPKFYFDFGHFSGIQKMPCSDGTIHFGCTFGGIIINQSSESNYIKKIYLVVWKNTKKRDETLRFGYGGIYNINDKVTRDDLELPIEFKPKEGKRIEIRFEQQATGTCDEKLIEEPKSLAYILPNNPISRLLAKNKRTIYRSGYELVFEDTNGNMFDQKGELINGKVLNLTWTLSNYNGIKRIRENLKIYYFKIFFCIKSILMKLGLF